MIPPKVEQIRANCKPFDVKVTMHRQKDRYYVKLALMNKIQQHEWINKWGGFYNFAISQVKPFYWNADLTSNTVTSATFFIGTFFDFIKGDESNVVMGYKGIITTDSSFVYCPYIPISTKASALEINLDKMLIEVKNSG